MTSASRAAAVLVSLGLVALATADSPPFQTTKISLKGPIPNQKGFTTWAAKDTIIQQFTRHARQIHPLPRSSDGFTLGLSSVSAHLCYNKQCADFIVCLRSIQHCLPIAVTLSVNSSFVSNASFTVNSTDPRSSYNVHPYVENGNLVRRISLACWL